MAPIITVNLLLCIIILILGIWGYSRKKEGVLLYIAIAFGLFGISHIITLLGLADNLTVFLIVIRLIAYLLVIFALWRVLAKRKA